MNPDEDRFYELVEKSLEDKLSKEESLELHEALESDPEFKELFFQLRHQHASLSLDPRIAGPQSPSIQKEHFQKPAPPKTINIKWLSLAALCLVGILTWIFISTPVTVEQKVYATLTKTEACIWKGGSLPTLEGSSLKKGTLHLDRGFASLLFHSGASLKLEGPAKINIIDDMNCELIFGNLVAEVPESAHKFSIKTKRAEIIDLGTSFSLNVRENGDALVNVIEGEVITAVHHSQQQYHLNGGEGAHISEDNYLPTSSTQYHEINRSWQNEKEGIYNFKLRSDDGLGDDTYVYSENHENKSDTLLLVKNGAGGKSNFMRQALLKFDLNLLPTGDINKVTLQLEFLPTGFGTGLELPDSVFEVYASIEDQWAYKKTKWENSPLHPENQLNKSALKKLGSFIVPRGQDQGIYELSSDLLKESVIQDKNRLLSLVIVRATPGNHNSKDTLVHGIASRRHPVAQPPTLKINLATPSQI